MSSNAGNSLWGRIQSWWKGVSGTPSEVTSDTVGEAAPAPGAGQEPDNTQVPAAATTDRTSADVQQRVSDINAGMREQASKMARPLEETGSPAPGTTGASTDEFTRGGYTPEPTSPEKVASAADDTVTPEPADVVEDENVGIPPSPSAGETAGESGASAGPGVVDDRGDAAEDVGAPAEDVTYATRVDDVTSGQDVPERADAEGSTSPTWGAETAEALEDTPAATGQDEDDFVEAGMTGADTESADAGQPVGQGATFDPKATTSGTPPVYDEGTAGTGTIQPAGAGALEGEPPVGEAEASFGEKAGGGTYAATAGDIATAGPSSSDDLGIDSSADLDATELGTLEDSETPGSADVDAVAATALAARFGDRPGADLSRTGLYADVRGDADPSTLDEPESSSPAGPSGTPIEETIADRGTIRTSEGAGNMDATAGDDYSAARSAEMTAGTSPESTTSSAIGLEMARGSESGAADAGIHEGAPATGSAVEGHAPIGSSDDESQSRPEGDGYPGAVRGDGTADTPPGYPIKGKASSMVYHTPDMPSYRDTKPDWCFATEDDATAAGFRAPRPRNLAGNPGPAAAAPVGSAGDTGSGVVDPRGIGGDFEPGDVAPASKMIDSLNRYSDPAVSGGGRLTEEVMDANPAGAGDPFGSSADDIESLSKPSPDDAAAADDAIVSSEKKPPGEPGAT